MRKSAAFVGTWLFLSLSLTAAAEEVAYEATAKGNVLVAGSVSIRNTVNAPGEWVTNQMSANPRYMYYVAPNVAFGVDANFNVLGRDWTLLEYGLGPRLGYYFGRQDARAHPYVEAGLCFRGRTTGYGTWSGGGVDVSAGVITLIGPSWGTEIRIGYLWETLARSGYSRSNGVFMLGAGLAAWAKKPEDLKP